MTELKTCEQQYDSIKIENEEEVARYYKLKKKLELVQEQMAVMMNEPKYLLPFLQPGRLVTVSKIIDYVTEKTTVNVSIFRISAGNKQLFSGDFVDKISIDFR
jgi:hypothetical protein